MYYLTIFYYIYVYDKLMNNTFVLLRFYPFHWIFCHQINSVGPTESFGKSRNALKQQGMWGSISGENIRKTHSLFLWSRIQKFLHRNPFYTCYMDYKSRIQGCLWIWWQFFLYNFFLWSRFLKILSHSFSEIQYFDEGSLNTFSKGLDRLDSSVSYTFY